MEAATQAETLIKEAQEDAKELLAEMGQDQEDPQDETQLQQPLPSAYKFIEIPSYAYTTDLDTSLSQIYMEDKNTQKADHEWGEINWGDLANKVKDGVKHWQPKVKGAIDQLTH